jgi:glycosyltransferase involved in cell wall biosynthesis
MSGPSATWLYAVVPAAVTGIPADLRGVAGEPVRAIEEAGLRAVVGTVPLDDFGEEELHAHLEDLAWLETAVRAHHTVIETLARAGRVVPLRFATIYHDDTRVSSLLAERRADFEATLERVAGRTEWGVKAYADANALAHGGTGGTGAHSGTGGPANDAEGRGRPGTAYLLQRRERRRAQETAHLRASEQAEAINTVLAGLADSTAEHPPQDAQLAEYEGWMVLNNSYLVPESRTADFAAAVASLDDRFPDIRLESNGPWPPYSFTARDGEHDDGGGPEG